MTQTRRYLTIKIDLGQECTKLPNGSKRRKDAFFDVQIIDDMGDRILFSEKIGKNFTTSLRGDKILFSEKVSKNFAASLRKVFKRIKSELYL